MEPRANGSRPVPRTNRILFVEDHASTQTTITRLLSRRGYEVIAASSLAEARRRLAETSFDLIISDLGLPDGDGCELMKELRASRASHPPGIAVSGFGMEGDVSRARAAGFNGHLTKPIRVDQLETVVRRLADTALIWSESLEKKSSP